MGHLSAVPVTTPTLPLREGYLHARIAGEDHALLQLPHPLLGVRFTTPLVMSGLQLPPLREGDLVKKPVLERVEVKLQLPLSLRGRATSHHNSISRYLGMLQLPLFLRGRATRRGPSGSVGCCRYNSRSSFEEERHPVVKERYRGRPKLQLPLFLRGRATLHRHVGVRERCVFTTPALPQRKSDRCYSAVLRAQVPVTTPTLPLRESYAPNGR